MAHHETLHWGVGWWEMWKGRGGLPDGRLCWSYDRGKGAELRVVVERWRSYGPELTSQNSRPTRSQTRCEAGALADDTYKVTWGCEPGAWKMVGL